MGILDEISKKAHGAVRKTKELNDVAKIKFEIAEQQRKMQKIYAQIGAKYYALHREHPDEELAPLCQSISECQSAIETMQKNIQSIKNTVKCPNCGAECNANFPFCGMCGNTLPVASEGEEKRRCIQCGTELREGAVYCTNCGTKNEPSAESSDTVD